MIVAVGGIVLMGHTFPCSLLGNRNAAIGAISKMWLLESDPRLRHPARVASHDREAVILDGRRDIRLVGNLGHAQEACSRACLIRASLSAIGRLVTITKRTIPSSKPRYISAIKSVTTGQLVKRVIRNSMKERFICRTTFHGKRLPFERVFELLHLLEVLRQ